MDGIHERENDCTAAMPHLDLLSLRGPQQAQEEIRTVRMPHIGNAVVECAVAKAMP
jgi:hypothetical protein